MKIGVTFTGKETDWETGYSYFGARYYDPTLLTSWTAVDPMADKYPSLSPYNYCAWNPMKIVDPDGRDWYQNVYSGAVYYNSDIHGDKCAGTGDMKGNGWVLLGENDMFKENENDIFHSGLTLAASNGGSINQVLDNPYDFSERNTHIRGELMLEGDKAENFMKSQGYKKMPLLAKVNVMIVTQNISEGDGSVYVQKDDQSYVSKVDKIMTNNSDVNNHIDNYTFSISHNGVNVNLVINNIHGIAFSDGTIIVYNLETDGFESKQPQQQVYDEYVFVLKSQVLKDDTGTLQVDGIQFKAPSLDGLSGLQVTVNGQTVTESENGYYAYKDTAKADTSNDFTIIVKAPEGIIVDTNFINDLQNDLNDSNNVQALSAEVTPVATRFALELPINDDMIFDLLNDDNLGGNQLRTVEDFTVEVDSTQQIDISALLSNDANKDNLSEFVTVKYDADQDQAVIAVDRDGSEKHYQSENLLVLLNQAEKVTLDDLINNHQIIY